MTYGQQNTRSRKPAKHREYSSLMTRQLSFNSSQMTPGQSAAALARAGFFYAGHKDYVKCFCCGILITRLHPGEDAISAHKKKSPNCSFIAEPNVEQDVSSSSTTQIDSELADRLSEDMTRLVLDMGFDAEIVERAYQLCTQSTSDQGPVDITQLTNRILHIQINESQSNNAPPHTLRSDADDTLQERTPSYIQHIEQEVHQLRETLTCKICMDNPVNTVTMPCRHFTSCVQCSSSLTHCPQCRGRIMSTVRVYI